MKLFSSDSNTNDSEKFLLINSILLNKFLILIISPSPSSIKSYH